MSTESACYTVTRHHLPADGEPEIISLSISREVRERHRILTEFTEALGEPVEQDVRPNTPVHVDIIVWLAKD